MIIIHGQLDEITSQWNEIAWKMTKFFLEEVQGPTNLITNFLIPCVRKVELMQVPVMSNLRPNLVFHACTTMMSICVHGHFGHTNLHFSSLIQTLLKTNF